MKITSEDVLRVAELAHLELTAAEVETFRGQLDSILEYVEKLNQLDTANVEPMAGGHPSEILHLRSEITPAAPSPAPSTGQPASARAAEENPSFRDDVPWPAPPILPADALRAAPDAASEPSGAFFRVPKVIER